MVVTCKGDTGTPAGPHAVSQISKETGVKPKQRRIFVPRKRGGYLLRIGWGQQMDSNKNIKRSGAERPGEAEAEAQKKKMGGVRRRVNGRSGGKKVREEDRANGGMYWEREEKRMVR